jgi:hypothetical protein
MRSDGLPAAKSCLEELITHKQHIENLTAQYVAAEREASEARACADRLLEARNHAAYEIAQYAAMVISNLQFEISEQLPSMWRSPVKIDKGLLDVVEERVS